MTWLNSSVVNISEDGRHFAPTGYPPAWSECAAATAQCHRCGCTGWRWCRAKPYVTGVPPKHRSAAAGRNHLGLYLWSANVPPPSVAKPSRTCPSRESLSDLCGGPLSRNSPRAQPLAACSGDGSAAPAVVAPVPIWWARRRCRHDHWRRPWPPWQRRCGFATRISHADATDLPSGGAARRIFFTEHDEYGDRRGDDRPCFHRRVQRIEDRHTRAHYPLGWLLGYRNRAGVAATGRSPLLLSRDPFRSGIGTTGQDNSYTGVQESDENNRSNLTASSSGRLATAMRI